MVRTRQQGLSLVEILVVLAIIALLGLVAVPFTSTWIDESRVAEGTSIVKRVVSKAQATALRNPEGVIGSEPAAGIKRVGELLLVCSGDPSLSVCSDGGSAMVWREEIPDGVSITLAGNPITTLDVSNQGRLLDGFGRVRSYAYVVSRGGVTDNDADNVLY